MSPAARELAINTPKAKSFLEERLLAAVAVGTISAHEASEYLIPNYLDPQDAGVMKMRQASLEDFEFYRDLYREERKHDGTTMRDCAHTLRKLWGRD